MMRAIVPALRLFLALTVLTGVIYPLMILFFAHTFFSDKAWGSLIVDNGRRIGSRLIAQKFSEEKYFWPRPSAIDYNALASGGSNFSMISAQLRERMKLDQTRFGAPPVPLDLLMTSASGLDPEISPAAALYQVERVARARGVTTEKVIALVQARTENRQMGFLGEPRVNVLELNLSLECLSMTSEVQCQ